MLGEVEAARIFGVVKVVSDQAGATEADLYCGLQHNICQLFSDFLLKMQKECRMSREK